MSTFNLRKVFTGSVLFLLLVVLVIQKFFIGTYRIPQDGMYPGLPAGSRIFAKHRPYSSPSEVKRGDIVVFVREEKGEPRYNYIWRIVGLPGETIETTGESLTINGRQVQRQRLREENGKVIFRERIEDVSYEIAFDSNGDSLKHSAMKIPPGHFFVMGDNRNDARDSRYLGPVEFASILSKKL